MDVKPRFRVGPFQVSGGGCMTAIIVAGILILCCPWSSAWDALTR